MTGEIPAIVSSDMDLEVVPQISAIVDFVPPVLESSKPASLNHGAVLFAPAAAGKVSTPFGEVHIDAGSLVLVIVLKNGVSVYDLHDKHGEAVRITCGEQVIKLFPGMHAQVGPKSAGAFGDTNPAQTFAYRNLQELPVKDGLRAFRSQFSIPVAMQTVLPLKQLTSSKNIQARKLALRMIKTAAIINDLNVSGEPFHRCTRTPVACWNH